MGLVSELRRRNVLRMVVLYVIAAWLIMQVADVIISLANLPEWVGSTILVLLTVGFPIALILSWFYELTPEGISLEKDVEAAESITHITGRRMDFIVISLLCAGLILFAYDKWLMGDPPEQSIAVLPFENISEAKENAAFLAVGIHDDLLMLLSKFSGIKVISKTSVERYKDTDASVREIGQTLGVTTVLEGGVQRSGQRIRVNAQLINVDTDTQLWAESYDRELTASNVFSIQREIAKAIADELRITLTTEEQERLAGTPTQNFEAYRFYLLARQQEAIRTSDSVKKATGYFQQAVELDPGFALAHAALANSYVRQWEYAGTPKDQMAEKARAAIKKALSFNDPLAESYAITVAAEVEARAQASYITDAIADYQRALSTNPNDPMLYRRHGILLRMTGRREEALSDFIKSLALDPLSAQTNESYGSALRDLGRFDEALAQYEKTIEIEPRYSLTYWQIGGIYWAAFGQLDKAYAWYRKAHYVDPTNPRYPATLGLFFLDLGDDTEAEYWIRKSLALAPESFAARSADFMLHSYRDEKAEAVTSATALSEADPLVWYGTQSWWPILAQVRDHDLEHNRYLEARNRYETLYPSLSDAQAKAVNGTNYQAAIDLAYALQELDEKPRATQLLDLSLAFTESIPRLGLLGHWISDVRIHAMRGETAMALTSLRHAIDEGWRINWWYYAEHDQALSSLRDEPEFRAMIREIKTDMATQLQHVREMDDWDERAVAPEARFR